MLPFSGGEPETSDLSDTDDAMGEGVQQRVYTYFLSHQGS